MARAVKLKVATWVLGGLLGVVVLLIALLHTPPVRRYALRQAMEILGRQGIRFTAANFDYNLLELTATLNNVEIRSPQEPQLPPLLEARSVRVDLSLRKLISGEYHIEDAVARDPRLHVYITKDGRDNIPRPPKKETETKTEYLIDKLLVEGGSLRYQDEKQGIDAMLPLARITVDGDPLTGNHAIDLYTSAPGTVTYGGQTLPLRNVGASVLLEDDAANLRKVNLALGDSAATLSGRIADFDAPRLDLRGDTTISLDSVRKIAGVQQNASGTVHAALTAQGPLNDLRATARVDGQDLTLDRFRDVDLKAEAEYTAANSRVKFASLNVVSPSGTIRGTADLALKPEAGISTANIAGSGLDLYSLSSTFKAPVRVASRADAKIDAQWPAMEFARASGNATVNLTATRREAGRDVLPVSGRLNARTQGNRIVVGIPELRAAGSTVRGNVTLVNQQALSGQLRIESADLAQTVSTAEAFLGRDVVTTPIAGSATVVADLRGTVKNPGVSADIRGNNLQVGQLQGATLTARADYDGRRARIDDAVIDWKGQTLRASGDIGLAGRAPAINLTASTQDFTVESILAGLNRTDVPASGRIEVNARVTGTAKAPEVSVDLKGSDLFAYRERIGTLAAAGVLRGDLFTLNNLRIDKPQEGDPGVLEATGTFNTKSKAVALSAKSNELKLTQLTLPDGRPVRGSVRLNASATGTTDDPEGTAEIAATNLRVGDIEIGTLTADARAANGQATVSAKLPSFNVVAEAQLATKAPYPADVIVRAENTDLASLPVEMKQPVEGRVSGVIKFRGDLQNPQNGEGSAELSQLDLRYNQQPLRSEGPLVARYANQRLTIDKATVIARDSRIALSGTLPLEPAAGTGTITLDARLDLPSLVQYLPDSQGIQAQGTATISGTVTGTLKRIDPDLTIALKNGYIAAPKLNPPVSDITVEGAVRNGALELTTATASLGPANLVANGTIPFSLLPADLPVEIPRRQGAASFTAELRDLDLATLEALPDEVRGSVSARLEATASRPELEALTGRLTFPTLKLGYRNIGLEQQGTSSVVISEGSAFVEQFHLVGPETNINIGGTAALAGTRAVDLSISGTTDAALAAAFVEGLRSEGKTDFQIALSGTASAPVARGYLQVADGSFSLREPRVGIEGLDVRIDLAGTRATVSRLDGSLNGGELTGGGTVDFTGGTLRTADLGIKATGVYLDIPEGLKTLSDINITMASGANDTVVLGGNVNIVDGGFTDDLYFDRGLLATVGQDRGIEITETRNPLLERVRFNIGVRTENPIVIDNNLAEAEVTADLRLLGDPYQFGLSGRLELVEGGELRLQEREYLVERGTVLFTNDRKIEPMLDILATTSAGGYDIRLQVTGTPGDTETVLTSDPPLPEPDILALLLTGRTMEEMRGHEFEVARNQVFSYLTGRVGSQLGRGIAGATGLSTVRIEPNLIAAEADPGARLTVGQNISRNLELIYSMDLVNSSDQIWVAEYDLTRRFTTRGVRQSDGSFRMDFRHDLRFGGQPAPRRGDKRAQRRVGNINIVGAGYFSELKIADKFDIESGDRYDFFKTRKGLDRVNEMYKDAGLLESKVRLRRNQQGETVDLNLTVAPGPEVQFVFEGVNVPGKIQDRVREIWREGVFDTQRAEESVEALRAWLVEDNRLRPQIEYRITRPAEGRKRVLFDIQPGPAFRNVEVAFEGLQAFKEEELRDVIDDQKLKTEVYTAPDRVTEVLTAFYREQGYLDAQVANPRYELDDNQATGRVVFPVTEGPLFRVGTISFEGNTIYSDDELNEIVPMPVGEEYRPVLRQNALDRLRQAYWDVGFNDVETTYVMSRSPIAGTIGITFRVAENRQAVVKEITVAGREHTSESLVRTQIGLQPGDIVDLRTLAEARRNLYQTGAYSLVEIDREELELPEGEGTRARTDNGAAEKPMRLAVRVREIQPWELRYGGFFDTERGPGGIVDFSNRNMLGSARVLGLRTRYDTQLREARIYFSQPNLLRFPLRTILSPYIRQERNPATEDADPFNVDRVGFSLQQEATWRRTWLLNYGYRIERTRTYDPITRDEFDVPLRIGALTATVSRETRDEILDATRGSFMSQAFQWSPSVLGSQLRFMKYFAQYFHYVPLQKERIELFTNQVLRPRLVYAGAVRVGLAKGFGGQEVPLSERFFAGGGTSIRGFEQNSVGPKLLGTEPSGGQAMLVMNNEIRFPVVSIFDGVGFVDIGNVYRRVSDFSLTEIRKTGGVGLRVRTPWFLLRLDYGLKLDRQPGESRGRLFFSIGQAF